LRASIDFVSSNLLIAASAQPHTRNISEVRKFAQYSLECAVNRRRIPIVTAKFKSHQHRVIAGNRYYKSMSPSAVRSILRGIWAVTLLGVVIGSLLPASSALLHLMARSPLNDKGLHFSAYLVLALLPVAGFERRRLGVVTGALMVLLGLALEGGQSFSPGRHVEFNDLVANGTGVLCGILLGLPLRS